MDRAHIVPRRNGGIKKILLCPTHHRLYDFCKLNGYEQADLQRYIYSHLEEFSFKEARQIIICLLNNQDLCFSFKQALEKLK